MSRVCLTVLFGLSFFMLTFTAHAAAPRDSGITSPLESLPQSVWDVGLDSTARHLQSQLECPFKIAGFVIQNGMTFDGVGMDVGCNYSGSDRETVTIYLTRRGPQSLDDDMDRATAELESAYADAVSLESFEMPPLAADGSFFSAQYLLTERNAHSGIWIADYSGWTLKFRATYRAGDWQSSYDAMNALLAAAERAKAQLGKCGQSENIVRDGRRIDDQTLLFAATMGATLARKAGSTPPETEDGAVDEPIWCVGPEMSAGNINFLFWNSPPAAEDPARDRITTPLRTVCRWKRWFASKMPSPVQLQRNRGAERSIPCFSIQTKPPCWLEFTKAGRLGGIGRSTGLARLESLVRRQ